MQVATKFRSGGNSQLAMSLSRQAQIFAEGAARCPTKSKNHLCDRVKHRVFYKGKLAKNEPKKGKFQNLVITFDRGVLLTEGQRI